MWISQRGVHCDSYIKYPVVQHAHLVSGPSTIHVVFMTMCMNVAKEHIFIYSWNIYFLAFSSIDFWYLPQIEQMFQFNSVVIYDNQCVELLFFYCTKNQTHYKILVPGLRAPTGGPCKSEDITGWGLTNIPLWHCWRRREISLVCGDTFSCVDLFDKSGACSPHRSASTSDETAALSTPSLTVKPLVTSSVSGSQLAKTLGSTFYRNRFKGFAIWGVVTNLAWL